MGRFFNITIYYVHIYIFKYITLPKIIDNGSQNKNCARYLKLKLKRFDNKRTLCYLLLCHGILEIIYTITCDRRCHDRLWLD